jgi:hypothetical protein
MVLVYSISYGDVNMHLLVYGNGSVDDVMSLVESVVPKENIEVCTDLQYLSARLRKPFDGETVVVLLLPANRDDLQRIISIQHLLENLRTIVVAPNQETETISMAHTLRPRFLTFAGEDLRVLRSVLYKMRADGNSNGQIDRRSLPRG